MNRDDIIRLAREAGFADGVVDTVGLEGFANFAALVAVHAAAKEREWMQDINKRLIAEAVAAEREACAKVCEEQVAMGSTGVYEADMAIKTTAQACAAAIRARSES